MKRLLLTILLLAASMAFGATAHVNRCANFTAATGSTIACTITGVQAGSALSAIVAYDGTSRTLSTLRDGALNNFTITPNSPNSDAGLSERMYIGYRLNVSAGNTTITATLSGNATNRLIWVEEISGVPASAGLDIDGKNTGSGTTVNLPSISTTVSGDFMHCAAVVANTITAAGGGFTLGTVQNGNADEYQVLGASGAYTANFSQPAGGSFMAMCAAYKPAGTTPATAKRRVVIED